MWKPVAFVSRSVTETKRRYSQIEKEDLALIWACKKFTDYVICKDIELETDHKPLVPLLGKTNLEYPWQRVASDLFELDKKTYLLIADYFSRYVEVQTLTSTTSASIICTLKSIFAQHGIPETFVSDNGPQYSSQEMKDFARDYNFATLPPVHTTLRGMG